MRTGTGTGSGSTFQDSDPGNQDGAERAPRRHRNGVRWMLLTATVGLVLLIGYLAVAAVVAAVITSAEGVRLSLATVLVAALPAWLAAFQVPLTLTGSALTALPLLPTILLLVLIAKASSRVARSSRVRHPQQAVWVILVMGLSHAVCGAVVALVIGDPQGPVEVAPVEAFLCCGAVATTGSTLGLVNRCGLLYLLWERLNGESWRGLRSGLLAVVAAAGVGAMMLVAAIVLAAPELYALSVRAGTAGEVLGSTLLSLLYLPDAVLAGWSFAAGTGVSVGDLAFRPLWAAPGPLPEMPLLAVLPVEEPAPWWGAVAALPAAVGVLVGRRCRDVHDDPYRRLRAVVSAALLAAVAVLGAAAVAGGRIGGGVLDPVSLHPGALALATFCWIVVPAAVTAWLAGPWPRAVAVAPQEPEDTVSGFVDRDEADPDEQDGSKTGGPAGDAGGESSDGGDFADGVDLADGGDAPEAVEAEPDRLGEDAEEPDPTEPGTDVGRHR